MFYPCNYTDSNRLVNAPNENSVSLLVFTTCSLNRFISCNSDISVETVIITGNTFVLWENHYLNVCLR